MELNTEAIVNVAKNAARDTCMIQMICTANDFVAFDKAMAYANKVGAHLILDSGFYEMPANAAAKATGHFFAKVKRYGAY